MPLLSSFRGRSISCQSHTNCWCTLPGKESWLLPKSTFVEEKMPVHSFVAGMKTKINEWLFLSLMCKVKLLFHSVIMSSAEKYTPSEVMVSSGEICLRINCLFSQCGGREWLFGNEQCIKWMIDISGWNIMNTNNYGNFSLFIFNQCDISILSSLAVPGFWWRQTAPCWLDIDLNFVRCILHHSPTIFLEFTAVWRWDMHGTSAEKLRTRTHRALEGRRKIAQLRHQPGAEGSWSALIWTGFG